MAALSFGILVVPKHSSAPVSDNPMSFGIDSHNRHPLSTECQRNAWQIFLSPRHCCWFSGESLQSRWTIRLAQPRTGMHAARGDCQRVFCFRNLRAGKVGWARGTFEATPTNFTFLSSSLPRDAESGGFPIASGSNPLQDGLVGRIVSSSPTCPSHMSQSRR